MLWKESLKKRGKKIIWISKEPKNKTVSLIASDTERKHKCHTILYTASIRFDNRKNYWSLLACRHSTINSLYTTHKVNSSKYLDVVIQNIYGYGWVIGWATKLFAISFIIWGMGYWEVVFTLMFNKHHMWHILTTLPKRAFMS